MCAVQLHGAVSDTIQCFITEHFQCADDLYEPRINFEGPQIALIRLP